MSAPHPLKTQLDRFVTLVGNEQKIVTRDSWQTLTQACAEQCDLRTRAAIQTAAIFALGSFTAYLMRANKSLNGAFALVTVLTSGASLIKTYKAHTWIRERLTFCDATLQMLTETTKTVQEKLCEISNNQVKDNKHTSAHAHNMANTLVETFFTSTKLTELTPFSGMAERDILKNLLNAHYDSALLNLELAIPPGDDHHEQYHLACLMVKINRNLQRLRYGLEGRTKQTLYFHMHESENKPRLSVAPEGAQ